MIREAILSLLAEEPMHGYQLMQEIAERTGGRWRPSAGSVYPTLQLLDDEGLADVQEADGRRAYQLTDAGRTAARPLDPRGSWRAPGDARDDLRILARELGIAAAQVGRAGSPAANDAARAILADARRSLYRLLADDEALTASTSIGSGAGPTDASPAG